MPASASSTTTLPSGLISLASVCNESLSPVSGVASCSKPVGGVVVVGIGTEGCSVGVCVEGAAVVGSEVSPGVGPTVGPAVGPAVGPGVGPAVGPVVGPVVGPGLGAASVGAAVTGTEVDSSCLSAGVGAKVSWSKME